MTLTLQPKDITWLSGAFDNSSVFSPFSYVQQDGFDENDKQRLISDDVIAVDGAVRPPYLPLLQSLNQVDRYLTITVNETLLTMRKSYLYAGDIGLSMMPIQESLLIKQPSDSQQMKVAVANLFGSSTISNLNWDVTLEPDPAKALFTMIDLQREADLSSVLTGDDRSVQTLTTELIEKKLLAPVKSSHELRKLLTLHETSSDMASSSLSDAIDSLISDGLVEQSEGGFKLCAQADSFAYRHQLTDKTMTIEMGHYYDDFAHGAKLAIIQSGANDLFLFQETPDDVTVTTMSAEQAQALVNGLIEKGPSL